MIKIPKGGSLNWSAIPTNYAEWSAGAKFFGNYKYKLRVVASYQCFYIKSCFYHWIFFIVWKKIYILFFISKFEEGFDELEDSKGFISKNLELYLLDSCRLSSNKFVTCLPKTPILWVWFCEYGLDYIFFLAFWCFICCLRGISLSICVWN